MKTLNQIKLNQPVEVITPNTINDCIYYDTLFLPCELKLEGVYYTMRFTSEDRFENINWENFINEFKFGINVAIGDGWKGMTNHLKLSGYGDIEFIGLMPTDHFLETCDEELVFLNEDLYKIS